MIARFRIDGILYNILTIQKRYQASIASRVKIMAGLNIAEKRLPQDGGMRIKIGGKDVDIRVSIVPTAFGERIVLRLLYRESALLPLEQIGFSGDNLDRFNELITRPHGIILVTGPTGSGKTTTLYASLSKINSPDKNIITIEDPIEYQLKGIGQIQVNAKIHLTFAAGLRSVLRQDPDVILVGEIRDSETAEIAIQAALTGPPRVLHAPYERFGRRGDEIDRHEDRTVPDLLVGHGDPRPAAGARALHGVPGALPDHAGRDRGARDQDRRRGRDGVPRQRAARPASIPATSAGARSTSSCCVDDEIRQLIMKNTDASTIKALAVEKGMQYAPAGRRGQGARGHHVRRGSRAGDAEGSVSSSYSIRGSGESRESIIF